MKFNGLSLLKSTPPSPPRHTHPEEILNLRKNPQFPSNYFSYPCLVFLPFQYLLFSCPRPNFLLFLPVNKLSKQGQVDLYFLLYFTFGRNLGASSPYHTVRDKTVVQKADQPVHIMGSFSVREGGRNQDKYQRTVLDEKESGKQRLTQKIKSSNQEHTDASIPWTLFSCFCLMTALE